MSYPAGSIPFSGIVGTTSSADTYPVTTDELMLGGLHTVADTAARNAIPAARRTFGMLVAVQNAASASSVYQLCNTSMGGSDNVLSNNSNWISYAPFPANTYVPLSGGSGVGQKMTGSLYTPSVRIPDNIGEYLQFGYSTQFVVEVTGATAKDFEVRNAYTNGIMMGGDGHVDIKSQNSKDLTLHAGLTGNQINVAHDGSIGITAQSSGSTGIRLQELNHTNYFDVSNDGSIFAYSFNGVSLLDANYSNHVNVDADGGVRLASLNTSIFFQNPSTQHAEITTMANFYISQTDNTILTGSGAMNIVSGDADYGDGSYIQHSANSSMFLGSVWGGSYYQNYASYSLTLAEVNGDSSVFAKTVADNHILVTNLTASNNTDVTAGGNASTTYVFMNIPYDGYNSIHTNGNGSATFLALENSSNNNSISLDGSGAAIFVHMDGTTYQTIRNGNGSLIVGKTSGAANSQFNAVDGSFVGGYMESNHNEISAYSTSIAFGRISGDYNVVVANSEGCLVGGSMDGSTSSISASSEGCFAWGRTDGDGVNIHAESDGSWVGGYGQSYGEIYANDRGTFAFGSVFNHGLIKTDSQGTVAFGCSYGSGSSILASGSGAFSRGSAGGGGVIRASGDGSFASGVDGYGDIYADGYGSHVFGSGNVDNGYDYSFVFGTGMSAYATQFMVGFAGNSMMELNESGGVRIYAHNGTEDLQITHNAHGTGFTAQGDGSTYMTSVYELALQNNYCYSSLTLEMDGSINLSAQNGNGVNATAYGSGSHIDLYSADSASSIHIPAYGDDFSIHGSGGGRLILNVDSGGDLQLVNNFHSNYLYVNSDGGVVAAATSLGSAILKHTTAGNYFQAADSGSISMSAAAYGEVYIYGTTSNSINLAHSGEAYFSAGAGNLHLRSQNYSVKMEGMTNGAYINVDDTSGFIYMQVPNGQNIKLDAGTTGKLIAYSVFMPMQHTTTGAPAYIKGGMYFDTTLNKLRIGGATAWETVTSV